MKREPTPKPRKTPARPTSVRRLEEALRREFWARIRAQLKPLRLAAS